LVRTIPSSHFSTFAAPKDGEIPDSRLFESFEDYDGTPEWLPAAWQWESKEGISRNHPDNITWNTTSASFILPSDGQFLEWINFSAEKRQDEWLISPSLVPQTDDTLFFDANFTPLWMLWDIEKDRIDFENPPSLLQALISTDNGKQWTTLWRAIDDYAGYTFDELFEYFSYPEWHEVKIPLKNYAGQPIKIAFQYKGLNGDSNGLDRISVSRERPFSSKAPDASYAIPDGFFLGGFTPELLGIPGMMLAPAYLPITWRNTSLDANQFHWEMPDIFGTGKHISTKENPTELYIHDGYYFPILTVNWKDKRSTPYSWGTGVQGLLYGQAVFFAGGNIAEHVEGTDNALENLGVGNFNLINGIVSYAFGENEYVFGTRPDNSIDAIANYFKKPPQAYVLDGVNIAVADFRAPTGTKLELILRRADENRNLLDTIAVLNWSTDTLINKTEYNLSFKAHELLVNDALFIELKGFNNKPGLSLACLAEKFHNNEDDNNAYLFLLNDKGRVLSQPKDIIQSGTATSLCFSLEMTYSFIAPQNLDYDVVAGPNRSEKTVKMTGYYPARNWKITSKIPGWLTVNILSRDNEDKNPDIRFTMDELPEGFERRYVAVSLSDSKGGVCTLNVAQDLFTGTTALHTGERIKFLSRGDALELIYPPGIFESVAIYTVSRQKTASYTLPTSGRFILPPSLMDRGMYLLQFKGKTATESIKFIR
jgi:hypothetical protein